MRKRNIAVLFPRAKVDPLYLEVQRYFDRINGLTTNGPGNFHEIIDDVSSEFKQIKARLSPIPIKIQAKLNIIFAESNLNTTSKILVKMPCDASTFSLWRLKLNKKDREFLAVD